MPVINITSRLYTEPLALIHRLADGSGAAVYTDRDILEKTGLDLGVKQEILLKILRVQPIPFNTYTHEREKGLSALKKNLAALIAGRNCILVGLTGLLIPADITHVYRILSLAPMVYRVQRAIETEEHSEKEAVRAIERADRHGDRWAKALNHPHPWDHNLYHTVLSADDPKTAIQTERIMEALERHPFAPPTPADKETMDFTISTDVEMALAPIARGLLVTANRGDVIVTLDKKVQNLAKIQQEIMAAAKGVKGVRSVKTRIGPNYYRGNIVRNFELQGPGRYWDKY